jgi:hypothetical protein
MNKKTKRLVITYSLSFLILYVFSICLTVPFRDHDVPLDTAIITSLFSIFGPWSTQVSKLTSLPHAGELCYPWLSLVATGLTAGLITVIRLSILSNKKWVAVFCAALYFPLILIWIFFGMGLMAGYLT